jgi:hypothetical protein
VSNSWTPADTNTHQDHVIAHVVGSTFLGYFIFEEALYILLDIGFVWTILLDGEMGLLPHPVATSELEINGEVKTEIKTDIELLLGNEAITENLQRLKPAPVQCQIKDVSFFVADDRRRLIIAGEEASLVIVTSLTTAEILVMPIESEGNKEANDNKLEDVAQTEHEYLHQRLRDELGREPTEDELDEWLRQHTEGY